MTDITADFNVYLKDKGAKPVLPTPYDLQHIETFLQEAYSIVSSFAHTSRPSSMTWSDAESSSTRE